MASAAFADDPTDPALDVHLGMQLSTDTSEGRRMLNGSCNRCYGIVHPEKYCPSPVQADLDEQIARPMALAERRKASTTGNSR